MAVNQEFRDELDRLRRKIDNDPDLGNPNPDLGAQLHAEKNAPWINGTYSHLKFPPFRPNVEYPKMLYAPTYGDARKAYDAALRIPARGTEDGARAQALLEANRAIQESICIVHNEDEERQRHGAWYETPTAAEVAKEALAQAVAQAAAESAYTDRHMSPAAKAERAAYDAEAEGHVVDVPAPSKREYFKKAKGSND
jgi:hypothetical protein